MSEQKYYTVGVTTPEVWDYVHSILTQDGSLDDNIPSRSITCTDLKEHSPTRAVYLMTDEEAAQISNHPDIKFIDIDKSQYPDLYPPDPEGMRTAPNRYNQSVKNYRGVTSVPTSSPTSAEANRAGFQLYRSAQYANPWQGQSTSTVLNNSIPNTNTGKNIDVIVGDDGCWFGHVEFQSDITGNIALPNDFVGGNKLPGNGTCNLLDVVLEGPYYIDPDWFNANPGARLTSRWDGTTVPVESVAKEWWGNSSARSSQFSTAGTVAVPFNYTRNNCNGTNAVVSTDGDHGTPCAGQTYGRTYGWAYNANKWFINAYGNNGFGLNVDLYFDVMKIFHVNKPINPLYGTKDPTISSNSWGFRAVQGNTGFYYFRQGASGSGGVAYSTKPAFMQYLGSTGDSGRFKGEMVNNTLTEAGDELIASGVIFVVAAGNSNQQQVGSSNPNFNNYWASAANTPLTSATHNEFGSTCYNTTSRRGFPQQLGKYSDGGNIVYPAINIGALDDDMSPGGILERKVNYSDMGDQIDCYSPGDGTLTPARGTSGYGTIYPRFDTYAKAVTTSSGFSGICSANALLTTTGTFSVVPNTGNQITTGTGTANVVSIASSLFGGAGLTSATTPTSGNSDDGFWSLFLPFNITFNGISYNSIFIGTNSYITFEGGSSEYSNMSASVPALPKIMISAADNSAQRIYYGTVGSSPNRTYRVRWEGTNATSGTLGSPNMVWEATFYENAPTRVDIQIGVNARSGAAATFYDTRFSGTSSACPTATGLIATALETNRTWTWQNVRTWLQSLTEQSASTFYQGPDPATATTIEWADLNSLMGGTRKVLYNNITGTTIVSIGGAGLTIGGSGLTINF